jgi:hypothetical protein
MSAALNNLLTDPHQLMELAQTTLKCAHDHCWDNRLVKLNNIYNDAIVAHHERFNPSLIQTTLTA